MEQISDYIIENFDNKKITIPWSCHSTIEIKDIVFISLHPDKFYLSDEYNDYIDVDDGNTSCHETDYLEIRERFDNYENVCLLYLVLYRGCHTSVYASVRDDESGDPEIFSSKFLGECLDYVNKYGFEDNLIGEVLLKLGFSSRGYSDGKEFTKQYLNKSHTKSARKI